MSFPNNVKYTKDHEWLRISGNEAVVGITHFAQSELGDIVFIDVDTEGESLEKEEVFGTIEAVKTVSDLSSLYIVIMPPLTLLDSQQGLVSLESQICHRIYL